MGGVRLHAICDQLRDCKISADERDVVLFCQFQILVAQHPSVLDRSDTGFHGCPGAPLRLYVSRNVNAGPFGFLDDEPDILGGIPVLLAIHDDLDYTRSPIDVFANSPAQFLLRIGEPVFRIFE